MDGSTFLASTAADEGLRVACCFLRVGICSHALCSLLLNRRRRRRRRCRCRRWYIADASRIPPLRSGPRGEWDSLGASILTALQVSMHLPQFAINLLRSAQHSSGVAALQVSGFPVPPFCPHTSRRALPAGACCGMTPALAQQSCWQMESGLRMAWRWRVSEPALWGLAKALHCCASGGQRDAVSRGLQLPVLVPHLPFLLN
jgi:hypothetical protein